MATVAQVQEATADPLRKYVEQSASAIYRTELTMIVLRLALTLLLVFFSLILFDQWAFPLNRPLRIIIWLAVFGGSATWIIRNIVPLLGRTIRPEYAAKEIERNLPDIKQGLITWVQLSDAEHSPPRSVLNTVGRYVAGHLKGHDVATVVDQLAPLRNAAVLFGLLCIGAIYLAMSPKNVPATIQRLLLPWQNIAPASRVQFVSISPRDSTVIVGTNANILIEVKGWQRQDAASVKYSTEDGQVIDAAIPMDTDISGVSYKAELGKTFGGIVQPLYYTIHAGDAVAGPFRIDIQSIPLTTLERVEYEFPEYMKLAKRVVDGDGRIEAPEGTLVRVIAKANQPMQNGRIEFDESKEEKKDFHISWLRDLVVDGSMLSGDWVLKLDERRSNPTRSKFRIRAKNLQGEPSAEPVVYPIQVLSDLQPEIDFDDESLKGYKRDAESILEIPIDRPLKLDIRALDPDYGILKIIIEGKQLGRPAWQETILDETEGITGQIRRSVSIDLNTYQYRVKEQFELTLVAFDNRHDPETKRLASNTVRSRTLKFKIAPPSPANSSENNSSDASDSSASSEGNAKSNTSNDKMDKPLDKGKSKGNPSNDPESKSKSKEKDAEKNSDKEKQDRDPNTSSKNTERSKSKSSDDKPKSRSAKGTGDEDQEKNSSKTNPPDTENSSQKSSKDDSKSNKDKSKSKTNAKENSESSQKEKSNSKNASGNQKSQKNGDDNQNKQSDHQEDKNQDDKSQDDKNDDPAQDSAMNQDQPSNKTERSKEPANKQQDKNKKASDPSSSNEAGEESDAQSDQTDGQNDQKASKSSNREKGSPKSPRSSNTAQDPSQSDSEVSEADDSNESPHDGSTFEKLMRYMQNKEGRSSSKESPDEGHQPTDPAPEDQSSKTGEDSKSSSNQNAANQKSSSKSSDKSDKQGGSQQKQEANTSEAGSEKSDLSRQESKSQEGKSQGKQSSDAESQGKNSKQPNDKSSKATQTSDPSSSEMNDSKDADQANDSASDDATNNSGAPEKSKSGAEQSGGNKEGNSKNGKQDSKNPNKEPSQKTKGRSEDSKKGNGQPEQNEKSAQGDKEGQSGDSNPKQNPGEKSDNSNPGGGEKSKSGSKQDQPGKEGKTGGSDKSNPGSGQKGSSDSGDAPPQDSGGESADGNPSAAKAGSSNKSKSNSKGGPAGGSMTGTSNSASSDSDENPDSSNKDYGTGVGSAEGKNQVDDEREYARQATDLVLDKLERERDQPDAELLKKMRWTESQLKAFLDRWKNARDVAQSDPSKQKAYDQMLDSLGLVPGETSSKTLQNRQDGIQGVREEGARVRPPESLRERFEAFKKAATK